MPIDNQILLHYANKLAYELHDFGFKFPGLELLFNSKSHTMYMCRSHKKYCRN